LNTPNIPTLDDLQFLNSLGRGAFGKVLRVKLKNDKIDRSFALKAMSKSDIFMGGYENEIKMEKYVLSLGNQSNFLTGLHSAFQNDTYLFFLMEYISGGDLVYHFETRNEFPESHAKFYAVELALAVIFLHEQGIIHRDLKPDNVLLDQEGHVQLADFGTCKPDIKDGGRTETIVGTPGYIAPEVLQGEMYGTSGDWWSYGVMLYEMITSYLPFDHEDDDIMSRMVIMEDPRYPGTQIMSSPAKEMIKKLLKKDPNERLASQDGNFNDVKNEEFFKDVKWDIYENRAVTPPFVPRRDVINVFEDMRFKLPRLSEIDRPVYDNAAADPFNGFDFYNLNFDF
jgi:serine/threonine protein kinase